MLDRFLEEFFSEQESIETLYAIIDAAKIKKLTNELTVLHHNQYQILFDGDEAIKYQEVAPYLIVLKKEDDFTEWVTKEVYGKSGAIFIQSPENIETLAEHLKSFIPVTREVEHNGKTITQKGYLAYYDPRVFPAWIESESKERQAHFFRPITKLYCEDEFKEDYYLSYVYNNELLMEQTPLYNEVDI